jgi:hypothetical protein
VKPAIASLLSLIAAAAQAVPVTVTWNAPAGYSPRGYVLGYGSVSGLYSATVDVGDARVFTIEDLVSGQTYYLSVRAYTDDRISAWSNEIVVSVSPEPPPLSVSVSPVVGLWGNSDEPGIGYSLDFKGGTLVVTLLSYNVDGTAQWYLAAGPLNGVTFTSSLYKFAGGQCISCAYTGPPTSGGDAGQMTIVFSAPNSALVHLPGGRVSVIRPVAF